MDTHNLIRTTEVADLVRDERIYDHVLGCGECRFLVDDEKIEDKESLLLLRVLKYGEVRIVPVEMNADHLNTMKED